MRPPAAVPAAADADMPGAVLHRALLNPRSLREALGMLRDEPGLVPIAGCTDVYVLLNFDTLPATRFMNLWGLRELRGITPSPSGLRIGALTTYTELIHSRVVNRMVPMLVAAAREVGGVQIQNRGTLGGNVANASPAGDTLPILAAADAIVELQSAAGYREVPFTSFYTGYRKTAAHPGELILAIRIPPIRGRQWFRKVGTRAALAISKVVMAGVGGREPHIAVGSVAPTVVRLFKTEAALAAGEPIARAQHIMLGEIAPIDDVRSTAEYRRRVAMNLLAEFWAASSRRAPGHAR